MTNDDVILEADERETVKSDGIDELVTLTIKLTNDESDQLKKLAKAWTRSRTGSIVNCYQWHKSIIYFFIHQLRPFK